MSSGNGGQNLNDNKKKRRRKRTKKRRLKSYLSSSSQSSGAEDQDQVQVSGMFMAGVGGMGGAGQDLISSCSSMSYSGDENDFQADQAPQSHNDWSSVRDVLVKNGHFDLSIN